MPEDDPAIADMIRVRVDRNRYGGTYRGVLVVTVPPVDVVIDGFRHQHPGRTYTRRVGQTRLNERDAFEDAAKARRSYIAANQLP